MTADAGAPEPPPPGEPAASRRPTLRDIAAQAGVSKGLASMILNGAPGPGPVTTARVLEIADRLGYRKSKAATLLAKRRTRLLGVTVLPSNEFHGELVEEIQAVADDLGYEIVLGAINQTHDEQRTIETLVDFRCEALLLLGMTLSSSAVTELVAGTPAVSVGRRIDLPNVDVVRADDGRAFHHLVDHLVGLGHRRIAHLDGGHGPIADLRRRSYRAAMRRHGLDPLVLSGGPTERHGETAMESLPRGPEQPTAIVAFNDRSAIGAMGRLKRVCLSTPGDVSVTGYDDSIIARNALIDLTTVNQSTTEQARLAVQIAIERLEGDASPRREIVLDPRLVIRSSTGPPRP